METNVYWSVRGTYAERKAALAAMPREQLEASILDGQYNNFLSSRADDEDDKRIPYIGWFWRYIQFSNPTSIPIGDCGEFIGFMANNKWDHPERYLTLEESEKVIAIIDEAIRLSQQGGILADIEAATNAKLRELWDYMQTLAIEGDSNG